MLLKLPVHIAVVVFLVSCSGEKPAPVRESQPLQSENPEQEKQDYLQEILSMAKTRDTLQFIRKKPFLFVKSGQLFKKGEKSVIMISGKNDSIAFIERYNLIDTTWVKQGDNKEITHPLPSFAVHFTDFNFDGNTDLFITDETDGYGIERGELLLSKNNTGFISHRETRHLGNLRPDAKNKTLQSDSVVWCQPSGFQTYCRLTYKWTDGSLRKVNITCPCEDL